MPILTYFAMGSITVQLSSSLAGLDKVSLHTLKLTIYLLIFFNPNQLKSRPMIRCLRLLRYPTTFQFKSYLKRFFNWGGIDLKLTDMFFNEWPVSNFEIKAKQNIKKLTANELENEEKLQFKVSGFFLSKMIASPFIKMSFQNPFNNCETYLKGMP